jgi:hypothetical protein
MLTKLVGNWLKLLTFAMEQSPFTHYKEQPNGLQEISRGSYHRG